MIKLKTTISNLRVFLDLSVTMETELSIVAESIRKLTIDSLQLKVDINELNVLITKIKIILLKKSGYLSNQQITVSITPVQSFIFVKYQNYLLPAAKPKSAPHKIDAAATHLLLDYSSKIHKQLTDLRI